MILAITNTNEKLIRELCAKHDYDEIEVYTRVKDLQDLAIRELQNLSNFKYLILDITDLKEKEETILKSVVAIKSMHNIRIIIMATGYKEGIYNFIIGDSYSKQDEKFEKCLFKEGNEYKDAVRFRMENAENRGIAIGREEGIKERNIQIVKNMFLLGMKLEEISKATGLSKEEIEKLK